MALSKEAKARFNAVWEIADSDDEYLELKKKNWELEQKYFEILGTLPYDQQDIFQDYLMNCEGMSWRMLEIACTLMRFPTDGEEK